MPEHFSKYIPVEIVPTDGAQQIHRTDVFVHGRDVRQRVIAVLTDAFPNNPEAWRLIGKEIIVEVNEACRKALAALAPLGKVSLE